MRTPPTQVTDAMLALPGVAVVHLVRLGWTGTAATGTVAATLSLVSVAAVVGPLAVRVFRWDPRR